MKASKKILFGGLFLFLLSLLVYDLFVRAEYRSADLSQPLWNYEDLPFKDFSSFEIRSSTVANVKFVQGPFSVKIEKDVMQSVSIKQQGERLLISASFDDGFRWNPHAFSLVISCPKLMYVYAGASYTVAKQEITDTLAREGWGLKQVLIEGFSQDSLHIEQDFGSTVTLSGNKIRSVVGIVGRKPGSGSKLKLLDGNVFDSTSFEIMERSKLQIDSISVGHFALSLASNSQLIISGKAQQLIDHKIILAK